jgi:hypothetical protein
MIIHKLTREQVSVLLRDWKVSPAVAREHFSTEIDG